MAGGITLVYLDIDDEITSAAARIRSAEEVRVALVVPSGSRLATSRINFRLLAREAQGRSRQLLIVAPDGATRSLAASAGLTVYPTVRDLEESFAAPPTDVPPSAAGASVAAIATGSLLDAAQSDAGGASSGARPTPGAGVAAKPSDLTGLARPADAAGRAAPATDADPTRVIPADRLPMARPLSDETARTTDPYAASSGTAGRGGPPSLPVVHGGDRRGGNRLALVAVGAFVVLVALVAGILGYVFLPAATIVVTPRVEPIALTFNVTADPAVTQSDAANSVVPATVESFPLDATATFPATGKKVTNTKATGTVTFSSLDPARSNTIPAGSIVATTNDTQFTTMNTVHLLPATLVSDGSGGFKIVPATGDSRVTAVQGGPTGNVDAGAIRVVPPGENGVTTKVVNKDPTTGGTHNEALQVSQKDIDAATATLTKQLTDQLDATVANPTQVLPGSTVFPETKSMTTPSSTTDPATLVGQLVDSFSYDLSATGSVTAVDETAVNDV
ncbi:MAG TPA: baseplate J/gp47 family protein, partial [Candidatus Acidoferrum sp.]|nr:baseplate J/gp47 family protein [Candidatus Acidoferrum sp.]